MIGRWFLILSFAAHAGATPNASASWSQLAERMTGESDLVRTHCLETLQAMPDLDHLLRSELREPSQISRTKMYLALDVITALKRRELLPDLIELSETEPSGYLYHAINTLVTPQNRAAIIDLYRARVVSARTPPAARMALIDTLARFGFAMKASDLQQLLTDQASGVRKAALSYARSFLLRGLRADYGPLVMEQLKQGAFLIRVQAVFLLRELEQKKINVAAMGRWRELCRGDASETLRKLCEDKQGGRR